MKNRVLIYCAGPANVRSGIYYYSVELADFFLQKEYEVTWLSGTGSGLDGVSGTLQEVITASIWKKVKIVLRNRIKGELNIFTSPSLLALFFSLFDGSHIIFHDFLILESWRGASIRRTVKKATYFFCAKLNPHPIFISAAIKKKFDRLYGARKDFSIFPNIPRIKDTVENTSDLQYELNKKMVSVCFVGGVEKYKGFRNALNFSIDLISAGWKVTFTVTRQEPYDILCRFAEGVDGLLPLLVQSDGVPSKCYAMSSFLLFFSYGEGFGRPLYEAAKHSCIPLFCKESNIAEVWEGIWSDPIYMVSMDSEPVDVIRRFEGYDQTRLSELVSAYNNSAEAARENFFRRLRNQ